jgi:GxxExxY protein
MTENSISGEVVDAWELERKNLKVVRQRAIPVSYGDVHIATAFFADLIVEDRVIVEVKSIDAIAPVHKRQLLTYLRLAGMRVGLPINFNVVPIKDGVVRIANEAQD